MLDWVRFVLTLAVYVLLAILIGVVLANAAELKRSEIELLARVVQRESTGESVSGQRAVAWTAVNRLRAGSYGRTLAEVLGAPGQYARPARAGNSPAYQAAFQAASSVALGQAGDITGGATHFCRCDMRRPPAWAKRMLRTLRMGKHCFYRRG